MAPRKPLRPEEVKEEWREYFDFNKQEMRDGGLCILASCPDCQSDYWIVVSYARHRQQSPYCYPCSRRRPRPGQWVPLRREEVESCWQEYYDFSRQEPRRMDNGRTVLCVRATCPICSEERWQIIQSIRRVHVSPRCQQCAHSGQEHYSWAGGRHKTEEGYVRIHLATLPASERPLAEPMTWNDNYLLEHRWVMAKHLGRPLTNDEIVHHRNGIKDDNHQENLGLLTRKTHGNAWGDPYYQKWQESLAENERLKKQLRATQAELGCQA